MLSNHRPRVLYVDDDEDSRVMLKTLFALSRIEAETAETATRALSLIRAKRFDLYVLDARLPQIDGFELCRQLRALDEHTPIVFFSGAAYVSDREKGFAVGANAYVAKPDLDGLLQSIRQFVPLVEAPPAKIIPFRQKTYSSPSFTLEPSVA